MWHGMNCFSDGSRSDAATVSTRTCETPASMNSDCRSLGSASAQWAVTAPIFVPMLMLIGYSPEAIQAAYRIGDSTTNIITPMMSYFGLILAWATRYQKDLGVGTLIAMMLPYSMFFLAAWSVFFYLWTFILGLPVGPGSPTFYEG